MSLKVKKDNHFLPKMYLKNWCNSKGKVYQYKTLVQHENVHSWKDYYLNGIGYAKYLYVDTKTGEVSDDLESWFDRSFEAPAEKVFSKLINNYELTELDYKILINFVALQDVRTPKRYFEHLGRSDEESFIESVNNATRRIQDKIPPNYKPRGEPHFNDELPIKVMIEEDSEGLIVEVSRLLGRASWLWSIKHILSGVASRLYENSWTILHPAEGLHWFTSDNPVVRLNYYENGQYDFKGGWGNFGSEILFPLSPRHLLYTQVGHAPTSHGQSFSIEMTNKINRLIAENSYRYVISDKPSCEIQNHLPRIVDRKQVEEEKANWENWHNIHSELERLFYAATP